MFDKRPEPGDLVYLFRSCGCFSNDSDIGMYFVMGPILALRKAKCRYCGVVYTGKFVDHPRVDDSCIPVDFLRRVPPLHELAETVVKEKQVREEVLDG